MISEKVSTYVTSALDQLYQERNRIDAAISKLEALLGCASPGNSDGQQDRPGPTNGTQRRSTAGWTPEKREAAAERMRQYWANRRQNGTDHDSSSPRKRSAPRTQQPGRRSTAGWTPEKREAAAERMREYWAERKRAEDSQPEAVSG